MAEMKKGNKNLKAMGKLAGIIPSLLHALPGSAVQLI